MEGLEEIHAKYHQELLGIGLKRSAKYGEDAVQDAYLSLAKTGTIPDHPLAYLAKAVLRRIKKYEEKQGIIINIDPVDYTDVCAVVDDRDEIWSLSKDFGNSAEVMLLKHSGYTYEDLSLITNTPTGTLKSRDSVSIRNYRSKSNGSDS